MNNLPVGIAPTQAPATNAPVMPAVNNATPVAAATPGGDFVWSTVGEQTTSEAGVKILAYGGSGFGKTVLMATLPQPFVVVSTENGLLSLTVKNLTKIFIGLGMTPEAAEARAQGVKQQPVMIVKNGLQLKSAFEWLASPANMKLYKSVGWDSASETAEAMLNVSKAIKADGRQAYGEVADTIAKYFRKFRDELPGKHICITAKLGTKQDGVTGQIIGAPDFPGKQLGPQSPYWMDECFRIGVATDPTSNAQYRFIQTQPNEAFDAKDRSGMLDTWERPDLEYLINKITGQ